MFHSEKEYLEAKAMNDTYQKHASAYLQKNKTNSIPGEISNKFPFSDKVNNDLRSSIEVWEFMHNIPERYMFYINEETKQVTTWTGENLGSVFLYPAYCSNFGDVRHNIEVKAINGKTYYGTYYKSAGDYAFCHVKYENRNKN